MMSFCSFRINTLAFVITITIFSIFSIGTKLATAECYTSIFAFGDSVSDNGNLIRLNYPEDRHQGHLPNGETYFHRATGRCCDGRLIVDLLAEKFGFAMFPPPVAGISKNVTKEEVRYGANFAVAGSRVLDPKYYDKLGIPDTVTNVSLRDQLDWFKDLLPTFCGTEENCRKQLKSSFVILGPLGGNDYRRYHLMQRPLDEQYLVLPLVVDRVIAAASELIELGVETVFVPSLLPDGCQPAVLTYFSVLYDIPEDKKYDDLGCLIWIDTLLDHHDQLLREKLHSVRRRYPHANVIYADYFSAAMQLYRNPKKYGFNGKSHVSCCGYGGPPYNFYKNQLCGDPLTTACPDPSVFLSWDGDHFTEHGNKWMVKFLLEGPFTYPPINVSCSDSIPTNGKHSSFK